MVIALRLSTQHCVKAAGCATGVPLPIHCAQHCPWACSGHCPHQQLTELRGDSLQCAWKASSLCSWTKHWGTKIKCSSGRIIEDLHDPKPTGFWILECIPVSAGVWRSCSGRMALGWAEGEEMQVRQPELPSLAAASQNVLTTLRNPTGAYTNLSCLLCIFRAKDWAPVQTHNLCKGMSQQIGKG